VFLSNVTESGPTPALVKTLVFNEARLKMIAENVANLQTPGYRAKQLDPKAFQHALGDALATRGDDPRKPLVVHSGQEVTTTDRGELRVTPTEKPVENVLFHDGTNLSIEQEMADLAKTGLTHELATALLRDRMQGLRKAIRGTV
jgi:flagellar basal-body rod protein FlgB